MPRLLSKTHNFKDIFRITIICIFLTYSIVTLVVMLLRIQYPYQLEWMEGGEIEHIKRLLEGKKIYVEPSLDFIPYIYTPFFYYIGVFISIFFDPGLYSMRLVSVISFLLSLFFVYKIVMHYTNDKFWSFVGLAIYVMSFSTTGFWFDNARVDTTANLFLIVAFYFLLKDQKKFIYLSALFSFIAFYTKQSYFVITMFLVIALFFHERAKGIKFLLFYFSLIFISTFIETIFSDGWYLFWNFYFPSTHHWIWNRAITFWTIDVLPFYSIALASIFALFYTFSKRIFQSNIIYLIFLFFGCLLSAYVSRLHYGGYLNVIIPFVFPISVCFPVALWHFEKRFVELGKEVNIFNFLLLFQIFLLAYDPIFPIPREKDKLDVEQILKFAIDNGGETYLMGYNFVQNSFGLKSYPHYVLLNDLFISNVPQKNKLVQEFESSLRSKKFKAIILDEDLSLDYLDKYYVKTNTVFYHRVFNSKQSPYRKEVVWVPK